ncbi:phage portal protein [Listeria booriae]|nr:phage portal protein [Listeria booriae]MBC1229799.1 phage portal protein [Listeria booriae]
MYQISKKRRINPLKNARKDGRRDANVGKKVTAQVFKDKSGMGSNSSNQINAEDKLSGSFSDEDSVINPPYNLEELSEIAEYSTILQQCIDAYKTNIIGFGIEGKSRVDLNGDEITEADKLQSEQEQKCLSNFIKYANMDEGTEAILQHVIEDRERTGNGYIEVLRNGANMPDGFEFAAAQFIRVCKKTNPVDVTYKIIDAEGKETEITRKKRFRRYLQVIDDKKIWFKEYGDPRPMNYETGKYGEAIAPEFLATELLHFKIGSGTYGKPRFIGNIVGLYGARKAEELNLLYFRNGRHVPAAITVTNGELDDESYKSIQEYMNNVSGSENAHQFLLLEVKGDEVENQKGEIETTDVKVEIKSLADMLQKDALFLEYDESHRKKMRSAFRLPPLYTGEADEYNKATAETAKKITEEQVFQPERRAFARTLNAAFLEPLGIHEAKLEIKSPDLTDITSIAPALYPFNSAGAVLPNDIRPLLGNLLGKKVDDVPEEFNKPIQLLLAEMQANNQASSDPNSLSNVQKSFEYDEQSLIMKDMRDLLMELRDHGKI